MAKNTQLSSRKLGAIERIRKRRTMRGKNDPLGSYTGVPKNPHDRPEQDADDL